MVNPGGGLWLRYLVGLVKKGAFGGGVFSSSYIPFSGNALDDEGV